MWFLMAGLLGAGLKYFGVDPVAKLDWWIVLVPFGLAAAWWAYADASGYTKRRVVERENARRQARIDRQRSNIGLPPEEQKRDRNRR